MKTYGVIMAGGDGTRFWPLSRKHTPKQLLNLDGKETFVNEAIDRLMPAVTHHVYIVTNSAQAENMRRTVAGRLPESHVLVEPVGRNTAACIGYAAMKIKKKYGDSVMVVTPSDAYIKNEAEYERILNLAVGYAREQDKLVTIGITPTFPATGYGYIEYGKSESPAKPVLRFVEKPNEEHAKEFLEAGNYVWNSGVFVWKTEVILQKFRTFLPEVYAILEKIAAAFDTSEERETLERLYPLIPSVSVDYGILEKTEDILVLPAEFGWCDIGSWDMLGKLYPPDEEGNVAVGDVIQIDTKNTVVYGRKKLIATVGVDNLIIVDTPDVTLVCPLDKAQDVKKLVEELKKRNRGELL